jgi:peptide subunit release factor 1 (eRF1)
MTNIDDKVIGFQCPHCGCALELTIGQIKSPETMQCSGCGVGISTDAENSSNAAADIREAAEKVPAEITIKFIDRAEDEDDGA